MTAETTTSWSCDRCGAVEVCPQRDQPAAWAAVMAWTPPLMSPLESNERRLHLCPECHDLLAEFLTAGGTA